MNVVGKKLRSDVVPYLPTSHGLDAGLHFVQLVKFIVDVGLDVADGFSECPAVLVSVLLELDPLGVALSHVGGHAGAVPLRV